MCVDEYEASRISVHVHGQINNMQIVVYSVYYGKLRSCISKFIYRKYSTE